MGDEKQAVDEIIREEEELSSREHSHGKGCPDCGATVYEECTEVEEGLEECQAFCESCGWKSGIYYN